VVYNEITDPFRRLVRIMQRLQEPGGCPWDLEQTHESLKPYMIEEAYEALEAIDQNDPTALAEELGDVLLQVLFHSVLSARNGGFTIEEVCSAASNKMVRRHPHVFGEVEAKTAADVLRNWEVFKAEERKEKASGGTGEAQKPKGILSGVPRNLPALLRAQRVQEKAARTTAHQVEPKDILSAIREKLDEIESLSAAKPSTDTPQHSTLKANFGELLFDLANFARVLHIDSENALREAGNRFQEEFTEQETT
jgi:tetrapyrrole methylase family protein / MazG family protein